MNRITLLLISFICLLASSAHAKVTFVTSQQQFDDAHDNAATNDSIVWPSGTYSDIFMDISKNNLYIGAETLGGTIFTGDSRADIDSDYVTLRGFQFLNGDIGTRDVINTRGSYNVFTQINIRAYRSYKYLRVRESSQYCEITYCNFENRLNLDDQNILSILVDENTPGYHKIQYCSFKNFDGTGNDLGIEPIRIGLSTQADHISRSLVEYCYFTQCNGDGEIISSKASQNVYRYNTFENNPKAELVLRHGSDAIVYGNFFLNGKGGVRVREGQNHYIYNNYFFNLIDRTIYLQNEDSDPLDNINIAFNTIFNCDEVRLGGSGNNKPTNVTFSNNIFSDPNEDLFDDPTGTETWLGNIASGNLGMALPSSGVTVSDPLLVENEEGYFGLTENSPAINAAVSGYAALPQFEGIAVIDVDVLFDLMAQDRPQDIGDRDLGCNEYPHNTLIQPRATEANTGPDYETSTATSIYTNNVIVSNLIKVSPNPVSDIVSVVLNSETDSEIVIEVMDINGRRVERIARESNFSGVKTYTQDLSHLSAGIYTIHVSSLNNRSKVIYIQSSKVVKL